MPLDHQSHHKQWGSWILCLKLGSDGKNQGWFASQWGRIEYHSDPQIFKGPLCEKQIRFELYSTQGQNVLEACLSFQPWSFRLLHPAKPGWAVLNAAQTWDAKSIHPPKFLLHTLTYELGTTSIQSPQPLIRHQDLSLWFPVLTAYLPSLYFHFYLFCCFHPNIFPRSIMIIFHTLASNLTVFSPLHAATRMSNLGSISSATSSWFNSHLWLFQFSECDSVSSEWPTLSLPKFVPCNFSCPYSLPFPIWPISPNSIFHNFFLSSYPGWFYHQERILSICGV